MEDEKQEEKETKTEEQDAEKMEETQEEKPEEKTPEPTEKKPSIFSNFKIDIYIWMIVVLSILAIIGMYVFGWQKLLPQLIVSVIVATTTDTVIKFIKTKQLKLSKTGIITGLFVGSILAEGTSLQLVVLAALIAEVLKHIIRYQGRNIFNPALLSLFVMTLAFGASMTWWASASIQIAGIAFPAVVVVGLFISWQYKRFSLTLPMLAVYFVISLLLTGIANINANSLLALLQNNTLYYFVFLMIVEPKSSPVFWKSRIAYGITAAILLSLLPVAASFADLGLVGATISANIFAVTILISNALGRIYERIIK